MPLVEVPGSRTDVQRRERPPRQRGEELLGEPRSTLGDVQLVGDSAVLLPVRGQVRVEQQERHATHLRDHTAIRTSRPGRSTEISSGAPASSLPDGGACPPGPGPARGAPAGPPRRSAGGSTRGGRTARLRPGGGRVSEAALHRSPASTPVPDRPEGTRGGELGAQVRDRTVKVAPSTGASSATYHWSRSTRVRVSAAKRLSAASSDQRSSVVWHDADWVPCPRPAVGIDPREQAQRLGCHVHHEVLGQIAKPRETGWIRQIHALDGRDPDGWSHWRG